MCKGRSKEVVNKLGRETLGKTECGKTYGTGRQVHGEECLKANGIWVTSRGKGGGGGDM